MTITPQFDYIFRWGNNPERKKYKNKPCRVLVSGKMNSCLLEFEDGHKMTTSRNAIKRGSFVQRAE